jgi:uncharacterized protein YndB with AHSA1/START domain
MKDLIAELERMRRTVGAGTLDDRPGHTVELRRTYDAPIDDVWSACTDPERLSRWFLPVTGELKQGGTYQLENNAGGEILECERPRRVAVTWVYDQQTSLVDVDLAPVDAETTALTLRHTVGDDDHWATFGPGAPGVGWDLALLGLAYHLRGEPLEESDLEGTPAGLAFMRRSASEWGAAHEASGAPADTAREVADRTSSFYAPDPEAADS